jgi:hypothetical protein
VLVYPIGIPVLYAVRLARVRSLLKPQHNAQLPLEAVPLATAVAYADDDDNNSELSDTEAAVPTAAPVPIAAVGGRTVHNVPRNDPRPGTPQQLVLQETRFLWQAYKPSMYYWEVMECVRRLLLTGFVVFIFPGTAAQAAVACMLAVLSMVVEAKFNPLLESTDAMLYMTGCIIIFLSMFMSLLIRGEAQCTTCCCYCYYLLVSNNFVC